MSLVLPLFHSKGQAAQQPLDGTPIVHANDIEICRVHKPFGAFRRS